VRVFGHANAAGHTRVQPYVAVNWIRESGDNRLRFDGERLAGGLPRDRVEASAGAQVRLGSRWSAWGDLGWQRGDGGYREANASLGLRAAW
jgi:autotransporter family porin